MTKILFIYSTNKDRSKTAEDYYSAVYPEIVFESAGTNEKICRHLGTNYITKERLEIAYQIFVMETKHLQAIQSKFGNTYFSKITVLY